LDNQTYSFEFDDFQSVPARCILQYEFNIPTALASIANFESSSRTFTIFGDDSDMLKADKYALTGQALTPYRGMSIPGATIAFELTLTHRCIYPTIAVLPSNMTD